MGRGKEASEGAGWGGRDRSVLRNKRKVRYLYSACRADAVRPGGGVGVVVAVGGVLRVPRGDVPWPLDMARNNHGLGFG